MTEKPKKIAIVSYHVSESDNSRPKLLHKALKNWDNAAVVTVYCSNFGHIKKEVIEFNNPDFYSIEVPKYQKNISLKRFWSHINFSINLAKALKLHNEDIIYICVPCYSASIVGILYKFLFKKRLIIDVVDIWPEAFPMPTKFNFLLKFLIKLTVKPIRAWLFQKADLVLAESNYFREQLGIDEPKCKVLSLAAYETQGLQTIPEAKIQSFKDCIYILYLGSLNSITDIDSLLKILINLKKYRSVHLSVIGGGNRLNYLKNNIENLGISSVFHGITFDPAIKQNEFMKAHFGYNGFVEATEVALSYKSLEYLAHGIPLLNSVKGDTAQLVENNKCGFNFAPNQIDVLIDKIISLDELAYGSMTNKAVETFNSNFSFTVFQKKLRSFLEKLI